MVFRLCINRAAGAGRQDCLSHSLTNRYWRVNKAWENRETAEMVEEPPRKSLQFNERVLHSSLKTEAPETEVTGESRLLLWKS